MSTPRNQPPAPWRRRIAGERRGARPTQETGSDVDSLPPPTGAPVSLKKARVAGRRPAGEPTRRSGSPGGWLGRRSDGRWGSRGSLVGLSALLALLVAVSAAMALGLFSSAGLLGIGDLRQRDRVEQASETAPSVAEQAAATILAYDFRTLDADRTASLRFMSPDFAAKYKKTFDRVVRSAALDTRAKVTADVKASAVIRATEDRVRVLVFVDQTTVSKSNPAPQQALNRVEMVMVKSGNDWLVDDITSY